MVASRIAGLRLTGNAILLHPRKLRPNAGDRPRNAFLLPADFLVHLLFSIHSNNLALQLWAFGPAAGSDHHVPFQVPVNASSAGPVM